MGDSTQGTRIRAIRKHLSLSQNDFAKEIGFSRSYLANVELGKDPVTERMIKLIENIYNANGEFIREGKGNMFSDKDQLKISDESAIYDDELISFKIKGIWRPGEKQNEYNKSDIVIVPVYSEVDAGNAERLFTSSEPIDWVPIKVKWLGEHVFAVKVVGNSMEPSIRDGSVVLIDGNQQELKDGKVFALEIPYIGTTIKKVIIEYQNFTLKPENPAFEQKTYPLKALKTGDILVIGRVIRVITEI